MTLEIGQYPFDILIAPARIEQRRPDSRAGVDRELGTGGIHGSESEPDLLSRC